MPRPVQVYVLDWTLPAPVPIEVLRSGVLPLPDRPSMAILPFTNMSQDVEQEYFADGLTEDLITALAKYRWFFVIARNSSFTYQGPRVSVAAGRPRARRALCPRGQHSPIRQSAPRHRAARRSRDRPSSLGRTLRPRPRRSFRAAGRDRRPLGRGHRARNDPVGKPTRPAQIAREHGRLGSDLPRDVALQSLELGESSRSARSFPTRRCFRPLACRRTHLAGKVHQRNLVFRLVGRRRCRSRRRGGGVTASNASERSRSICALFASRSLQRGRPTGAGHFRRATSDRPQPELRARPLHVGGIAHVGGPRCPSDRAVATRPTPKPQRHSDICLAPDCGHGSLFDWPACQGPLRAPRKRWRAIQAPTTV